ncbi:hypothetical protein D3C76_1041390 [compost metagenome]
MTLPTVISRYVTGTPAFSEPRRGALNTRLKPVSCLAASGGLANATKFFCGPRFFAAGCTSMYCPVTRVSRFEVLINPSSGLTTQN